MLNKVEYIDIAMGKAFVVVMIGSNCYTDVDFTNIRVEGIRYENFPSQQFAQ